MPNYFSQDFRCRSCGFVSNRLVERDARDQPVACEVADCGGEAQPTLAAPMVMKAAFHDGVRRPGFREGVLAAELEAEAFNKPPAERKEVQKEIDRLRKADT